MPQHPISGRDREEAERRAEDEHDEEAALQELVERAAEQASLPFTHPSVHRLARRERARRHGWPTGREAA
jgi:hypothetical protein